MGDGSTAGAKDVSDELENEDQLLGNKQEQKENNEDEPPEDGDAKGKLTDAAVNGIMAFAVTRWAGGVSVTEYTLLIHLYRRSGNDGRF